ncbi:hypothetical protein GLOIN_2v1776494 [Rhizophagus irregularis DAOM 181602=DAOM 197198]|nr:hypothetical protein GLOIN_2v1776494 [Rhizophagus irregularis DAOM 181602=DAOM 197198]
MILKFYWNTLKMKWTPKNKRNTPWRLLKTKGTPPGTPLVTLGGEKKRSWRQKEHPLDERPLVTLGDEKNIP